MKNQQRRTRDHIHKNNYLIFSFFHQKKSVFFIEFKSVLNSIAKQYNYNIITKYYNYNTITMKYNYYTITIHIQYNAILNNYNNNQIQYNAILADLQRLLCVVMAITR